MRNAGTSSHAGAAPEPHGKKIRRRVPADPFLTPSPENRDLSFLRHDESRLLHLVDHLEKIRRLRESIVFDFLAGDDDSPERWESLVAAASAPFVPNDRMLPADDLREPGVIAGMYDYFPIPETNPEFFDKAHRARMAENGQRPWVIAVTLNPERHDAESFLDWVNTHLVPRVVRSARELTQTQFLGHAAGAAPRRRGIRPVSLREREHRPAVTDERLRERLFTLACHRIRRSAEPGETMTATYARYRAALPSGVKDDADLSKFSRRVHAVNADSLAEWKARLGGIRLRTAVENRWIRFDPSVPEE